MYSIWIVLTITHNRFDIDNEAALTYNAEVCLLKKYIQKIQALSAFPNTKCSGKCECHLQQFFLVFLI